MIQQWRFGVHDITAYKSVTHSLKKSNNKYVGPVVIYKIRDPHNYLLMTLDGKILRGLLEDKRLKPANIRTNHRNIQNLAQLKQVMNAGFKI